MFLLIETSAQIQDKQFVAGDALEIRTAPDTASFLAGIYPIDEKGYVSLPIAGRMRIDTLSCRRFSSFLDTFYMRHLRYPAVEVVPLVRLSLLGGFHEPGCYYFPVTASLWEVVARAGGPVRDDGLRKIRWKRGKNEMKADMVALVESGKSLASAGVRSGDRLTVTTVPHREGWELFRTDVVPLLSLSITAISAAATLYIAHEAYQRR